jgi:hypothetical protein
VRPGGRDPKDQQEREQTREPAAASLHNQPVGP